MNNFDFYSPTRFIFGPGRENEVGKWVREVGGSRVLVHFGGGSVVRSGLLDRVSRSLDEAGLWSVQLGGVQPNPRDLLVYQGIELCRRENVDLVLGIGGGSALDTAKAVKSKLEEMSQYFPPGMKVIYPYDTTPFVKPIALKAGRHTVELKNRYFGNKTEIVDVQAGLTTRLDVELKGAP